METDLPLQEPALLLWLPVSLTPTDNDFVITADTRAHCRPQWWHTFDNLLEIFPTWVQGRAPWIKVGQRLFNPSEILDLVESRNCPADVIANAVKVMKIATGEIEEDIDTPEKGSLHESVLSVRHLEH